MASPLLLTVGFPVLMNVLGDALRAINHPAAKVASQSLDNVLSALQRGQISAEDMKEANRHAEAMAALQSEEAMAAYTQINTSLRAEIESEDKYVRRMRPTFGYLMAATWAVQMGAIAYVMVFRTPQAAQLMQAMESLVVIWAMGLSVLGIYVYKRSEDKKVGAGRMLSGVLPVSSSPPAPLTFGTVQGAGGGAPVPKPVKKPQFNE
jgi:hypothetical protein